MKVLHLADTPLSGAPYRLMQVQKLGGLDARLISHRNFYSTSSPVYFGADILLQNGQGAPTNSPPPFKREVLEVLFRESDVFHFHNYYLTQRIFRLFPHFKSYLKGKKIVFQVHSPRNSIVNVESPIRDNSIHEKLVIAQYQKRQFPDFTTVPNAVPINDPLHMPIERPSVPPVICFSPSNTTLKGWNDKGQKVVSNAIKRLKTPHEFFEVTHKPLSECLRLKQRADIAIDEVMTGSYHMCTLEALSMGQVVIGNIDEQCDNAVKEVTGGSIMPTIRTNKDTLRDTLNEVIKLSPKDIHTYQSRVRQWMLAYWNEEHITNIFRGIYER